MTAAPPEIEQEIAISVKEQFGDAVEQVKVDRKGRISIVVHKDAAREVAAWLHQIGFDHVVAVTGVDHLTEKRIDVIYLVSSYSRNNVRHIVLLLKVSLDRENPSLQTLTPIWASANFFEREAHEMFGVNFEGHPNLQKLLLEDNWDGPPPLRKDLKIPEMS